MKNDIKFENGNLPIKELFFILNDQPERLSEEDDYICPDPIRSYKAKVIICDSPNIPTKGSESNRND